MLAVLIAGMVLTALPATADPSRATGWIVVLSQGDPDAAAARDARAHGAEVTHVYRTVLRGYAARMSAQAAERVARTAGVAWVERDHAVSLIAHCPRPGHRHCAPSPSPTPEPDPAPEPDPEPTNDQIVPWGITRLGARDIAGTGAGTHVYVLDTGIDGDHLDLRANMGAGYAVEPCKGQCTASWSDDHGHGTHVAGTVGAVDDLGGVVGVAPAVTLHAVKVLSRSGSGSLSGVIAGIDWVAGRVSASGRPAVANMSLGASGSKTGTCTATGFTGTGAFHKAMCDARRAGVLFAVAAGNDGVDAAATTPAAFDDAAMTVSATSCDVVSNLCAVGSDTWPWWSNYGDDAASWTSAAAAPVVVAAPGVNILSTRMGGGTTVMSGTSMASPHVAGLLARWLATNSALAGDQFVAARDALLLTGASTSGWTNTTGRPHAEPFAQAS